jgi:DNA-binding LytR/AlgR family response regulator
LQLRRYLIDINFSALYDEEAHEKEGNMRIKINRDKKYSELEIIINASENDQQVDYLVTLLKDDSKSLIASKDNRQYPIKFNQIYYIESIDEKTFIYTENDSYIVGFRLYELESMYDAWQRISKNAIVNIDMVDSFTSTFNGKLIATLINKERIVVSRTYVAMLKNKLKGEKL